LIRLSHRGGAQDRLQNHVRLTFSLCHSPSSYHGLS
jgi:hypothetical protein